MRKTIILSLMAAMILLLSGCGVSTAGSLLNPIDKKDVVTVLNHIPGNLSPDTTPDVWLSSLVGKVTTENYLNNTQDLAVQNLFIAKGFTDDTEMVINNDVATLTLSGESNSGPVAVEITFVSVKGDLLIDNISVIF